MLFKVFLLSVIMMSANPTTHPVEFNIGQCIDTMGNGHALYCTQYELEEPYTYINYHGIAKKGEFVFSTFEMGDSGEPDDILFRHDLVIK